MQGKRLSKNEFIERAGNIHGGRYDYSKVIYVNNRTKVEIVCAKHGSFLQEPANHLSGKGCKKCASDLLRSNVADFIIAANKKHYFKYDYSKVKYVGCDIGVEIICPWHGSFHQKPDAHLHSNGCFKCGRESCGKSTVSDTNYFIGKASATHNNRYDYSKAVYVNNREDVIIVCPIHGEFVQMVMSHLAGKGCKLCATSVSHKETKWLDALGIPLKNRNTLITINNTWIKPDGFDPDTNTIYEFYGDFWHGNPKIFKRVDINQANGKTFGELFDKTIRKESIIRGAGYKLVSIWENDFEAPAKHG